MATSAPLRGVTQSGTTREFLGCCTVKNLARGGRTRKSPTFLFVGKTLKSTRGIRKGTTKKLMRGSAPGGLPAKRVTPLGREKPTRGIASCWFRLRQETIALQGTKP